MSGQAAIKLSDDIPAGAIEIGTGVMIAGLEAIVTAFDPVFADQFQVAFIGDLRPVAQGVGVQVSLPTDYDSSSVTGGDFKLKDATYTPEGAALRLSLVYNDATFHTTPTSAAQVATRNAAFAALKPGMLLNDDSSVTPTFRVLSVDGAKGTVNVQWLDAMTLLNPLLGSVHHGVQYDGNSVALVVDPNDDNLAVGVSQVSVTDKGVLYLIDKLTDFATLSPTMIAVIVNLNGTDYAGSAMEYSES